MATNPYRDEIPGLILDRDLGGESESLHPDHRLTAERLEEFVNEERKDRKLGRRYQYEPGVLGLLGIGRRRNDPMQRRRERQAAVLMGRTIRLANGRPFTLTDYEAIAETEAKRLKGLAVEEAQQKFLNDRSEQAERHRAFLAELEAEEIEERRKAIARANRSRFGKAEAKIRYKQPRAEPQTRRQRKNFFLDPLTTEPDKRAFLEEVFNYKLDTGVSIAKLAGHYDASWNTVWMWLKMWELMAYEHNRTGTWLRTADVRRAISEGARPGDRIVRGPKGKPRRNEELYPRDESKDEEAGPIPLHNEPQSRDRDVVREDDDG